MNKHLPKKAKDIKGTVAIAELKRAHFIIAILSISFAAMVTFVSAFELQFDAVLAAFATFLLLIVAGVSIATVYVLSKR